MENVNLSYILTTRNKLPFLTYGLNRLIQNLQSDEEIIVVDAGSTDGTVDFLKNLYKEGKINQFVSESDNGEGHGFNKGFLLANGILLKVITDDDFFNFKALQECKTIMLDNNHLDVMIGNICSTQIEDFDQIYCETKVVDNFQNYIKTGTVFPFTGLSLMIRKNSIALTGLFSTNVTCVDTEFSLRITEIGVKIAWSNAIISIRIENVQSNLITIGKKKFLVELDRFLYFYDSKYRNQKNNLFIAIIRKFKSIILSLPNIKNLFKSSTIKAEQINLYSNSEHVERINKKCEDYVSNINKEKTNFIIPS
tara:strand:+ start:12041 stop:12967 length:927 start_codon:yes stop_codon:yes gene_type:complete